MYFLGFGRLYFHSSFKVLLKKKQEYHHSQRTKEWFWMWKEFMITTHSRQRILELKHQLPFCFSRRETFFHQDPQNSVILNFLPSQLSMFILWSPIGVKHITKNVCFITLLLCLPSCLNSISLSFFKTNSSQGVFNENFLIKNGLEDEMR